MDKETTMDSRRDTASRFSPDPFRKLEASPASFEGVKAVLEFDLAKNRTQWLTACHANDWREVVETLEYRLANMECTPVFKPHVELIKLLLNEVRDACGERGLQTELMKEDHRNEKET
jgi:hypothetical protein